MVAAKDDDLAVGLPMPERHSILVHAAERPGSHHRHVLLDHAVRELKQPNEIDLIVEGWARLFDNFTFLDAVD